MKMEGMGNMQGMQHGAGFNGPRNTLPMMTGTGPFGPIEMGGMFTVVKIRDGKIKEKDAGWYNNPPGTVARCISRDLNFVQSLLGKKPKVSSEDKG